jgi:hypothetical protein
MTLNSRQSKQKDHSLLIATLKLKLELRLKVKQYETKATKAMSEVHLVGGRIVIKLTISYRLSLSDTYDNTSIQKSNSRNLNQ